jgi:hypothetical protein
MPMSEPIVEMPPVPDQPLAPPQQWPAASPVFGEPAEPVADPAPPAPEPELALLPNPLRHDLPSGGWVELRDLSGLKARDHKAILRGINETDMTKAMSFGVDMTDGLMTVMVTAWSLPYGADWAIPSLCIMRDAITGTPVVLDDMRAGDYAALEALVLPAMKVLFPKKADPSDVEDPASPTAPASA